MKIIVDTNIAFSAILNTNGRIGDILFNSGGQLIFYSCDFLRVELNRHRSKLLKAARKMTEPQLDLASLLVLGQVLFINENLIGESIRSTAESIVQDIDVDDTDFVALNDQLDALL